MGFLCRDCLTPEPGTSACQACGSTRVISHDELHKLAIGHIDCDAFYATVEKRDDPALRDRPVLVGGGGGRGVVMAACYVARRFGCHSAMPMFKARELCPDAVVIRPDMEKYQRVGREVRVLMSQATPLVEPLSVDEAFLDLSGTEKLHGGSPARTLARLVGRIEDEIGITATIGLSHNKFLAKIASDLDKPRGFAVIGRAETLDFLDRQPVDTIWGVGAVLRRKLRADGFREIGALRARSEAELTRRYGAIGQRLYHFSRGEDDRKVDPSSAPKSMSAETTFAHDLVRRADLETRLWPLCEKVAARVKAADLAGNVITLKLKTGDFRIRTRSRTLPHPTQLAEIIWRNAADLLAREATGTAFRLIGVGLSNFTSAVEADPPDLADPDGARTKAVEHAIDHLRARFGDGAIARGRGFESSSDRTPPGIIRKKS
ncbi:MAG: DNA polymerase IV [Alphaproteobacteria bacterium]